MKKHTLTLHLLAVTGSLCGPLALNQAQAAPALVKYTCSDGQDLTVKRSPSAAHVSLDGTRYELRRHPSGIGDKYLSAKEALIIDGNSAVFVSDSHLDLGTCEEALPVASAT